jgi:hypothetical protein
MGCRLATCRSAGMWGAHNVAATRGPAGDEPRLLITSPPEPHVAATTRLGTAGIPTPASPLVRAYRAHN